MTRRTGYEDRVMYFTSSFSSTREEFDAAHDNHVEVQKSRESDDGLAAAVNARHIIRISADVPTEVEWT